MTFTMPSSRYFSTFTTSSKQSFLNIPFAYMIGTIQSLTIGRHGENRGRRLKSGALTRKLVAVIQLMERRQQKFSVNKQANRETLEREIAALSDDDLKTMAINWEFRSHTALPAMESFASQMNHMSLRARQMATSGARLLPDCCEGGHHR